MNKQLATPTSSGNKGRLIWLAAGILLFGIMMGERGRFESGWQRSLAAASAAAVLVFCISQSRKARTAE